MLFFVKQNSRKATEKKLPTLQLRSFCYCNLISKIVNSNLRFSNNSVRFSCCNFSCLQIKWCCAFLTKFSLHNKFIHFVNAWEKKNPDLIKIPLKHYSACPKEKMEVRKQYYLSHFFLSSENERILRRAKR